MEKANIIIKQNSNIQVNIPSTINELEIDEKLKEKYGEKLIIDETEIKLCYVGDKVTEQEIIWLEQLGIYGELTFKQNIERIVGSTQKIEQYANLDTVMTEVKQKYQNAFVVYSYGNYNIPITDVWFSDGYEGWIRKKIGRQKIEEIIEREQLSDEAVIETTTSDSNINEIIEIANQYAILDLIENRKIGYIKENIFPMYEISYMICISLGENHLVVDELGMVDDNNKIALMSETEAEELFTFTENGTSDGLVELAITSYIGTEKNVRIPAVIYDENGNATKMITEITSLDSPIKPFYEIFNMSLEEYNNTTVAEIWNIVTRTEYEGENGTSTDNKTKYETLLPLLLNMGLTENDVILNDDHIPYVYFVESTPVPLPENAGLVEIETITIPNSVNTIATKACANQEALTEITYYCITKPTISTDAFEGCRNLIKISFPNWDHTYKEIDGQDTFWGAPNENVKIYDVNGEI